MPIVLLLLVALLLVTLVVHRRRRIPHLPPAAGDWSSINGLDPRTAMAAMMYAVAVEDGPLTTEKGQQILSLLTTTVGLSPEVAHQCLTGGRNLARRLKGDLNSRLHQLRTPIERNCSQQQKQDVIDMLRQIAGRNAERVPAVRDALGRFAASLLHG